MAILTTLFALLFAYVADLFVSIDNSKICASVVPIPEEEDISD